MGELNIVLRSLCSVRATGPDTISSDLFKGSPYILKLILLDHFKHCLQTSTSLDSWAVSEVVLLVKIQLDSHDLFRYRPICLINSMHIFVRISFTSYGSHFFSSLVRDAQFGFRPSRSTTQPIHIMRHILEVYKR